MDKQTMVHPYSAIKKDHCSMDEPQEHHVEQKKPDKCGIIHTA